MIDAQWIEEYARKYQTTKNNVAREYCQHLFLSKFYQLSGAERILFKGGTALRILWHSPRFSEDLDFQGSQIDYSEIEEKFLTTLLEVKREGLETDIQESKKTTGGYLGKVLFEWQTFSIPIKLEISLRKRLERGAAEEALIQNDFIPPYTLLHVAQAELIGGKISALLDRGKPRDFFDLYYILRSRLSVPTLLKRYKNLKEQIVKKMKQTDLNAANELKEFLPASHHLLLKNFRAVLEKELERAFPSDDRK